MKVMEPSAMYLARSGYKQTEVGVIPEDWVCPTVAQVAANRSNAIVGGPFGSDLVFKDYVATGIPIVRGQNMARKYVSGDFVFVSESKAKRLQANMARVDDIIFTQRGTLGQVSIVPSKPFEKYLVSQSQMKLTLNSDVASSLFVYQYFISTNGQRQILDSSIQTGVPHTNLGILRSYRIPLPPTKAEQEAIAEALNDADALIESLEQLLAKKRQLKQGAMQELLTGKKRLPGFSGKWEVSLFGEIAEPRKERIDPRRTVRREFCIELEHIEQGTGRLTGFTATTEDSSLKSVFQKDDVLFGKLRAYLRKYWLAHRDGVCSTELWVLTANRELLIPEYLFQLVKADRFIEVASSAYGTHMPRSDWNVVRNYEVHLPRRAEQTAIAVILSDMDAEIAALEEQLTKARSLRQGMMQELLTGRIRLV